MPETRFLRRVRLHLLAGWLAAMSAAGPSAAAAPPFEDSIAQRTLACTACHGEQGRAAPDGYYPRLAGKPAGYLFNQLLNFRDGRRHYGLMTRMVDPLSDAYLQEIAGYFAGLKLPYPPPQPAAVDAAVLARGRVLALQGDARQRVPACTQCHGTALTGVQPAVPGLLGLPRDYLNGQLGAWKSGERRAHAPDCMAQITARLPVQDLAAVAAWLSSQPLPADPQPATAPPRTAASTAVAPASEGLRCGSAPAVGATTP